MFIATFRSVLLRVAFALAAVLPWAATSVRGAAFTNGNIVILRVGDGAAAITSNGTPVFLDEYTTAGAFVQSVPVPTAAAGLNRRLVLSGTATSEGALSRSVNGLYLVFAGYDAAVNTAGVAGSAGSTFNRVVARVDGTGAIDTTTALADLATSGNPRSVASTDGTLFWGAGSAGGVRHFALGASSSLQLSSTVTNLRVAQIFNGQLYVSAASGAFRLATVGSGVPTTNGQTTTNLPGFPTATNSPYGYFFADLDATPGIDTVYFADDTNATTGGVYKYTLVGGNWTATGSVIATANVRGLTGSVSGGVVTLYATGGGSTNQLLRLTDSSGYNGTLAGSFTLLATGAANTVFRGVAFAPQVSGGVAPSIGTQPTAQTVVSGGTAVFTVVASGTAPLSYQWRKGGVDLSDVGNVTGSHAATLTLTGVTGGDVANYDVVVSNGFLPNATSTSVALALAVAPTVTTPPSSQTVNAGAVVQFTVAASGTTPFTYQWRRNTVALTNTGIVSGALTDTLTLTGVTVGDSGSYDVVVTNLAGSDTSAAATFVVNPAPVAPSVTTQPVAQSVMQGGDATFTVAAAGTAPFSYQWRKGGSPLSNGIKYSGVDTAALTVHAVASGDAGNYDVVVSNGVPPDATSNAAALTIAPLVTPAGQLSYTGGAYLQSFDTLPSAGSFTLVGNGPLALTAAPISASGLGGWSLARYDGTGTVALFRVDDGGSNSGGVNSYGTTAATDRALGSLASGSTISRFGVTLVNSTGVTISQFTLSYAGEQWRGGTGTNKLTFEYALGATDINTGTFVGAPALDFSAPNATAGALVGNSAANRVAISSTVSGLNWAPGQALVLRWTDVNDGGNDDGLAIDDLALTTPVTEGDILPAVVYTTPAAGTVNIPLNSAFSVTFNEAVNFSATAVTLNGSLTGAHSVTVSGGPVTYTVTPSATFGEIEDLSLAVLAAQVTDADSGTKHPGADYVASFITTSSGPLPIHTVQGSGSASAYKGYPVTVQGIVVASFQGGGGIGGYFIEAPNASQDLNPATSEGIYVFDLVNSVAAGDLVTITGTVTEFGTAPNSETEISALTGFTKVSSGNPLPAATPVALPFPSAGYAERYEGMLVTFPQALTVNDNFDYGIFGEVSLANGRLSTPTNVVSPGADAQALEAANQLNQILLDDGRSVSYPSPTPYLTGATPATQTLRAGSTATDVTGILDNRFGAYVIEPTAVPAFVDANPRPSSPASLGSLRVAIGNVENLMNGNGDGAGFPTSRGASTFAEYQRQLAKVTAGILAIAPDIMGLTEVENDIQNETPTTAMATPSYGDKSMIFQLVESLNANAPAGTHYAFVDASAVDIVTDVIHCAFIYRTETVAEAGIPAMLNSPVFNNVARNPLAQTFRQKSTGAKLTVCINHFRAKGSVASGAGNADSGDGQGNNNALRLQEAQAVTAWLTTHPTGDADPDVLLIGDLNAYAKEDPITHIVNAGYTNLSELYEGEGGYSYAFQGEFGHLDHALSTPSLTTQVLSTVTFHANSDEPVYYSYNVENKDAAQQAINVGTPYRYADHDPVVIGMNLTAPPSIVTHPASQSVTVGASVTFSVVAKGNPAPTYQWRKGGNPIAGATSDSYTIGSVVVPDAGSYDVVVTNSVGSATSNVATLAVSPATADVGLGGLAQTYDGTPRVVSYSTTPGGLVVHVTYDGSPVAPTNAGSYAVIAAVDDINYIGFASGTLVVAPAPATVSLSDLSQTYNGSGKAATVTTAPTGIATTVTYNGSASLPVNAGSYAVVATLANNNYTGAPASGTLTIAPAAAAVLLANLSQVFDTLPKPVTVSTTPSGLLVDVTYNGSAAAPTNVGSYAVVATVNEANYTGTASGTLVISAFAGTIVLDDLVQAYDGTAKSTTVTTTPAGLAVNVTYNGSATAPTYPGAYAVVATINDANYSGSATGTLYITTTAMVRHGPQFNGIVDGSVQVLLPESATLNSSARITGDLLVPGTPTVKLNGSPVYNGTIDSTGTAAPTNYTVTLNSGSHLRHVVRRVNALTMPSVSAPPAPTGTRNVTLNSSGQSPGAFATLRNLTLNSGVGAVTIPAGTYGAFTANGSSSFVLGVAGDTTPAVYNLQSLVLNGTSRVTIVGPVIINLASGPTLNGSMGAPGMPDWLELNIASGGLALNGTIAFDGFVLAPNGTVTINSGVVLTGGVIADRLTINSGGVLNEP